MLRHAEFQTQKCMSHSSFSESCYKKSLSNQKEIETHNLGHGASGEEEAMEFSR